MTHESSKPETFRSKRHLVAHLRETWHGATRHVLPAAEMERWRRDELEAAHARDHAEAQSWHKQSASHGSSS